MEYVASLARNRLQHRDVFRFHEETKDNATILVRRHSILVAMHPIKAVILADSLYLFESNDKDMRDVETRIKGGRFSVFQIKRGSASERHDLYR